MNVSNEVAMRRAFLKHNQTARTMLRGFPAKLAATYPFGKAKGLLQSARVLAATVVVCLLSWEVFVVMKVQSVTSGVPA